MKLTYRIPVTGLILTALSLITAAVLPKIQTKEYLGELIPSTAGSQFELTCTIGYAEDCNITKTDSKKGIGSRTTTGNDENGDGSSSITNEAGGKVRSLTSNAIGNPVQNINTSAL